MTSVSCSRSRSNQESRSSLNQASAEASTNGECVVTTICTAADSVQFPHGAFQRAQDGPLPARVQVALCLVDQQHDGVARLFAELFGGQPVFAPRQRQHVCQRDNAADAGGRVQNGNLFGIACANRRDIPRIVN